jgi:hypothetical protein
MKHYTVILLYPEEATDDFGHDTWMSSVQAVDPTAAVVIAREECLMGNGWQWEDPDDDVPYVTPESLFVIAVIEGDHDDVNPGPVT